MSFALTAPISIPLIPIVVAWATLLFLGYGLMSGGGVTSFIAVLAGALAIASAAYIILDLSSPSSGLFRVLRQIYGQTSTHGGRRDGERRSAAHMLTSARSPGPM
jgi:hypothetical protein